MDALFWIVACLVLLVVAIVAGIVALVLMVHRREMRAADRWLDAQAAARRVGMDRRRPQDDLEGWR